MEQELEMHAVWSFASNLNSRVKKGQKAEIIRFRLSPEIMDPRRKIPQVLVKGIWKHPHWIHAGWFIEGS